ncbi:MAG: acyltransferase [Candidatus Riflebacteria bacterium]|nr:acyltransferase [Candidatus Riflebacteria bacterium]
MERSEFETARLAYREFLASPDRKFYEHRFAGPRREVDFCICDSSMYGPLELLWLHARYGLLMFALALPWSWPKVFAYRLMGARIGRRVYISQRVYLDPLYPQLLSVGDDVLIGFGAQIFFHEITQRAYRVGRVTLGDGCIIGAGSMLRPGITVGQDAQVCGMTAVAHDVPEKATVFGVPARLIEPGTPAVPDSPEDRP